MAKRLFKQYIPSFTTGYEPIEFEFIDFKDLIKKCEALICPKSSHEVYSQSGKNTLMVNYLDKNSYYVMGYVSNFDLTKCLPNVLTVYKRGIENYKYKLPTQKEISSVVTKCKKNLKAHLFQTEKELYRVSVEISKYLEHNYKMERYGIKDNEKTKELLMSLPYEHPERSKKMFFVEFYKKGGNIHKIGLMERNKYENKIN